MAPAPRGHGAARRPGTTIAAGVDRIAVGLANPPDWSDERWLDVRRLDVDRLAPFTRAGKAVFVVAYELPTSSFCAKARAAGYMALRKRLDLGAWRDPSW